MPSTALQACGRTVQDTGESLGISCQWLSTKAKLSLQKIVRALDNPNLYATFAQVSTAIINTTFTKIYHRYKSGYPHNPQHLLLLSTHKNLNKGL